jgi:hypothetical protein
MNAVPMRQLLRHDCVAGSPIISLQAPACLSSVLAVLVSDAASVY